MLPINSIQECNSAAQAIGNSDITARETMNSVLPEGCYEKDGDEKDGGLWLSKNPINKGRGASSTRHPICKTTG